MAEVERMTVEEVVSYFLEGEGVDVLRESLRWVCQQLMEAEVSELDDAGVHGADRHLVDFVALDAEEVGHPGQRTREDGMTGAP